MNDVVLFVPEILCLAGALAAFGASVGGRSYKTVWLVSLLGALAAMAAALCTLGFSGEPFFPGIYRVDFFSQLLKVGLGGGLFLVLLLCRELTTVRPGARLDTPLFLLLSTAGMMMLVSATELLTLYVALELSAYGLYVTVALHRAPKPGAEAGVRYVVFGAVASAVTLYGISLIFGATGSTYLGQLVFSEGTATLFVIGVLLVFAGLFFKLALFPFHFWAPDVYEAAPHQVVTFVATISKLAAAGIIARVCGLVLDMSAGMVEIFVVLSVTAMTLGNLAALVQKDLKRLLGYSTVAHAGYLMLGYGAFSAMGIAAAIFYGLAYLSMSHLAFVVVCALGEGGDNPGLDSLGGLHERSPASAAMLLTAMFGLGGIPPTSGFVGKWFLFAAAIEGQQLSQFVLVLIAAANSTVALYYYLQVIKAAYLRPANGRPPFKLRTSHRLAGYVSMVITLLLGVYPTPLWEAAQRAASLLLH